jgi:hypothetical protein
MGYGFNSAVPYTLSPYEMIPMIPIQDTMDVDLGIVSLDAYEALLVTSASPGFGCRYWFDGL